MAKVHMQLDTEVMPIHRQEQPVETAGLVNPHNSPGSANDPIYLLDGEFVTTNGNGKWNREGLGDGSATPPFGGKIDANPADEYAAARLPCFPVWAERGRTDVQPLEKIPVLFHSPVLARFHKDVLPPSMSFAVGEKLYINWQIDGADRNRRRVLTKTVHANDLGKATMHGYVWRIYPNATDGFIMQALLVLPSTP